MYAIESVDASSAEDIEYLGAKPKFWFTRNGKRFLFKAENRNTGEDWAEKIVCELARHLGLPHVHYELAQEVGGYAHPGVVCERFVEGNQAFLMGNQLLFQRDEQYPHDQRYRVRAHTVKAVLKALGELEMPGQQWLSGVPPEIQTAVDVFVGYVMLDAWVANQDRHHQNWGAIRDGNALRLGPTFDHGASLARNLQDSEREARMNTRDGGLGIEHFAERARTAFYPDGGGSRTLLTFEAFDQFKIVAPGAARAWLLQLESISTETIQNTISQVPLTRMTSTTRAFTLRLLELNRQRLLETEPKP